MVYHNIIVRLNYYLLVLLFLGVATSFTTSWGEIAKTKDKSIKLTENSNELQLISDMNKIIRKAVFPGVYTILLP